ncbi:hypothetical protein [Botryobacter ruber]|uniref:hypothetical protein n=1 Tax=Botryobacter ruber TaxID=2171629 RepID=UPI000F655CEA|nr:hypothetical protein [Botryobacter ruber]
MKTNLTTPGCLLLACTLFACQSGDSDDKSLGSTHPKLEKQLRKDSVRTPISSDERPDLYQRYRITMEKYETKSDFKVEEKYTGELAPLDEKSHPEATRYKSALLKGMEAGINFADKYTVVTVGCGTACQYHYVVDRQTGKVTDKIQSSAGARYSVNSRIFIINPPDAAINYEECTYCTPEAFVIENGKFRRISEEDL